MTFGSLFAGIGGIDLGLERAGMSCAWQVEIDPWCRRVLAKHWPHVQRFDDVKTFALEKQESLKVDCIAGGFPCQDVSDAGHKVGLAGARSGLWSEFARIIRVLRPRYVLVENVEGLRKRGLGNVLRDLALLGYDAEWCLLSASIFGLPHGRRRLLIVAYPVSERRTTFQVLAGDLQEDIRAQAARRLGDIASAGKLVRTIGGRTRLAPPLGILGVDDGLPHRLDEPRLRGIGNAVVPDIAEVVARRIIRHAEISE